MSLYSRLLSISFGKITSLRCWFGDMKRPPFTSESYWLKRGRRPYGSLAENVVSELDPPYPHRFSRRFMRSYMAVWHNSCLVFKRGGETRDPSRVNSSSN